LNLLFLIYYTKKPMNTPSKDKRAALTFSATATNIVTDSKVMSNSTRFTVAIHILSLLAYCGPESLTSEFIAGSVNTNPVVIRRLLAHLKKAGLVSSQGGPGGGWQLLKPAETLTLRQVFLALEEDTLFPLHSSEPNPKCPVGRGIQALLQGHYRSAQAALEADLERTTLAQLVQSLHEKG